MESFCGKQRLHLPCFATGETAGPRRAALSLPSWQVRPGLTFFTSYGVSSGRLDAFTSFDRLPAAHRSAFCILRESAARCSLHPTRKNLQRVRVGVFNGSALAETCSPFGTLSPPPSVLRPLFFCFASRYSRVSPTAPKPRAER